MFVSKFFARSIFLSVFMMFVFSDVWAQRDMITGYNPRLMTRGKLWSTFRNNGLQGGGNRPSYTDHDQTDLEYPGNAGRMSNDFMEYWFDVEAIVKGEPNLIDVPRVCNPQNSKGEGVWILTVADGKDTMVSYSGPRDVTQDVRDRVYDIYHSPEAVLGDSTGPNLQRSNYSPYHNNINNEPVEIHNYAYGKYILNDNYPEEIIISQWTTKTGIRVVRKAYAWSYPDYDDFILEELIFYNDGNHSLKNTYLAFMNSFSVSSAGHQWPSGGGMGWTDWRVNKLPAQDDRFWFTKAPNYVADNPESTEVYKKFVFAYQRDDDWYGSPWDDTGQPYKEAIASRGKNEMQGEVENQLLAYQYIGFGPIDVMPPFVNDSETYVAPKQADQPFAEKWWHSGNSDQHDFDEPSDTRQNDAQMYRMVTNIDTGRYQPNPDEAMLVTHALVFGPYDLEPGQKAKIVIAFVGGSGADWEGQDEFAWSRKPEARRQLKEGEFSIFRNFRRAKFAYEMGYDLPDPPPDVAVKFKNNDLGQVVLQWKDTAESARDPDYTGEEAKDVRGYRIYRSWPPSFNWHYGPWVFVKEIKAKDPKYYNPQTHTYSFADDHSFAGYNYYYSVRTYDSGHAHWYDHNGVDHGPIPPLESGYTSPEQKNMIAVTPFQIATKKFDQMEAAIHVVPNPYRLDYHDNLHRYPDTADPYKIRFTNLPRHCIIRIYSVSGDLIYEREHRSSVSSEDAWRQDTISFSGNVVSGIYFWVVESLEEGSKGKIQKGTLAIVK